MRPTCAWISVTVWHLFEYLYVRVYVGSLLASVPFVGRRTSTPVYDEFPWDLFHASMARSETKMDRSIVDQSSMGRVKRVLSQAGET